MMGPGCFCPPTANPQPYWMTIRSLLFTVFLLLVVAAGTAAAAPSAQVTGPTTNGTVGYVDGYWYNDSLAVDNQADPVVPEEDLEAVIARTMARIERIRGETFQSAVPVEVMPRDEFQDQGTDLFLNASEAELRRDRVLFEAMFMLERDVDIKEEVRRALWRAVSGYYEPSSNQIVVIAEDTEEPELDEITLGHELVHALQDQRIGLDSFNRSTIDTGLAINGLLEGESVIVDRTDRARCRGGWSCSLVAGNGSGGLLESGPVPAHLSAVQRRAWLCQSPAREWRLVGSRRGLRDATIIDLRGYPAGVGARADTDRHR
ncbi:MAG: hypothetical protein U5K37_12305 [Natrialbaceae archaeon]|nr:hypothetical protein [Natrialbaceae archaeon]